MLIQADARHIPLADEWSLTPYEPRPFWQREWLRIEYQEKGRSAREIAVQFGMAENTILFWLHKHAIPTRSISDTRKVKHWGLCGPQNPMFGKRGMLNPHWKGGLTPLRQLVYTNSEWKEFEKKVKKRDRCCRLCGDIHDLQIHHIEPFAKAPLLVMDIGNVIRLCGPCHRRIQGKERRWRKKFYRLIGESVRQGR